MNDVRLQTLLIWTLDDQSEQKSIIEWTISLQDKYLTMVQKFNKTLKMYEKLRASTVKNASIQLRPLRLEPMKLPKFAGDIRKYPRFKSDFQKYILPTLTNSDSAAYILRTCLEGVALDAILNVDDDINAMWSRLDEKFGKPSKLVDLIMYDFKGMKVISDGNDKKCLRIYIVHVYRLNTPPTYGWYVVVKKSKKNKIRQKAY